MLLGSTTRAVLAATLTTLPGIALAHTGTGDGHGLVHGLTHPIGGIDHVLAMVTVGLYAAHLGGRALWLVPASFVGAMLLGGALGIAGVTLPHVETAIALSVVVLGLAVSLRLGQPTLAAMVLVGAFAVFHGLAHGAEMPSDASGLGYATGFALATAVLHAAGVGLGLTIGRAGDRLGPRIAQAGGGAIALAGVALLAGLG